METRILSSRPIKAMIKSLGEKRYNQLEDTYKRFYFDAWIRTLKLPTKLLGPRYTRSRSKIELDITYHCNLKCINCNRSCRQAPSTEQMTIEQIQIFIKESIEKNVNWERINVLGGEPTLHPDLLEILSLLIDYKKYSSSNVRIQLFTNGYGNKVASILSKVPTDIVIINSMKTSDTNEFCLFNKAPKDSILGNNADFSNGCCITSSCGIGLTPYGYYCCALAGSIDRVFGFNIGRKELPSINDTMVDQLQVFCELCGYFLSGNYFHKYTSEIISPSWKEAYKNYNKMKPSLSLYSSK